MYHDSNSLNAYSIDYKRALSFLKPEGFVISNNDSTDNNQARLVYSSNDYFGFIKNPAMNVSDTRVTGNSNSAQISEDEKDQRSLPSNIPSTTRIPLKFIENDPAAYDYLNDLKFSRAIGFGAMTTIPYGTYLISSYVLNSIGDHRDLLISKAWTSFMAIKAKYLASYVFLKNNHEKFDRRYSVAKIVEAYISEKAREESPDERKFKQIRWHLTQNNIAPRAFAIATNGDLIVYWEEPYILQKWAPIVYPIPYWIAPLEGWRKNKVRVKQRSKSLLGILKPVFSTGQSFISEIKKNGGIDFTSNKFLQTKNSGEGIKFHLDPAQLKELQNAPGFVPVIVSIEPLKDIKTFLGVNV